MAFQSVFDAEQHLLHGALLGIACHLTTVSRRIRGETYRGEHQSAFRDTKNKIRDICSPFSLVDLKIVIIMD
jgi:hypothetical protein